MQVGRPGTGTGTLLRESRKARQKMGAMPRATREMKKPRTCGGGAVVAPSYRAIKPDFFRSEGIIPQLAGAAQGATMFVAKTGYSPRRTCASSYRFHSVYGLACYRFHRRPQHGDLILVQGRLAADHGDDLICGFLARFDQPTPAGEALAELLVGVGG